jgi:ribosome-associated toxin RatA of RatAB toxin-antitoxin module
LISIVDKQITFERVIDVDHKKAFEVVSNFDKYAEFIPGCSGSSLIERKHPVEIGRLDFHVLGKDYFIESENTLTNNSININQIKGPFDHFKGSWVVKERGEFSCHVSFNASFQLPFLLNAITPQSLIDSFSSKVLNSFISRLT